jgi:hypothetical protein
MKQDQRITCSGGKTTSTDVCRWVQSLFDLHACIATRFARPEPHRRALAYLQGILSETVRKNGWQLAEHAGEVCPDGMQRLLSSAVWDTDGVRDESLVTMWWSNWVLKMPWWPLMKRVSSNEARSRLVLACNIVARLVRWRIVRSASFSPIERLVVIASLIVNCICPPTGVRILIGVELLVSQNRYAFR